MDSTTSASHETILKATQTLLSSEKYNEITGAIRQLHDIFSNMTGIEASDITDDDIYLSTGKAVSPIKAAHCLLEIVRTRKFLRGINKAILQLTARNPTKKINILYAGCGPYATLLTPFTSLFTSDQLSFTLMDINRLSLEAAEELYKKLGLLPFVKSFILADATTFKFNSEEVDLIISETMLNALRKEPQLSIMANLMPQLRTEAIFIPEEISVDAALLKWTEEVESFSTAGLIPIRIHLGTVYKAARQFELPKPLTIPLPDFTGHRTLSLLTDIKLFNDERLTTYNCSLTCPFQLVQLEPEQWPQPISFTYRLTDNPGFEYHLGF